MSDQAERYHQIEHEQNLNGLGRLENQQEQGQGQQRECEAYRALDGSRQNRHQPELKPNEGSQTAALDGARSSHRATMSWISDTPSVSAAGPGCRMIADLIS